MIFTWRSILCSQFYHGSICRLAPRLSSGQVLTRFVGESDSLTLAAR